MVLKFKKLDPHAVVPEYKTEGAAGMDLAACSTTKMEGTGVWKIGTGLSVEIPHGYEGQVRLRSSLGAAGFIIPNAPGTIDSDYRGEIVILLARFHNLDPKFYFRIVRPGDRVAQLVISPIARPAIAEIGDGELTETVRGVGGFGSTGVGY